MALDDQPWVLGRGAQETSRVRPAGLALALKLGEPAEASARTDPWNTWLWELAEASVRADPWNTWLGEPAEAFTQRVSRKR